MKTMKKLQVAVAAATLFAAAGSSMAASISQSGVTIAREAVSANTASIQTLRAPTVTFNFDNGPAANANSTQDFNVTLTLGGSHGQARWFTASANYKTVSALRRNNGNAVVPVLSFADANNGAYAAALAGKVYFILMSVDVLPGAGNDERVFRYKFRLVNNTASSIGIGDLQLNFNGQNPGDGVGIHQTTLVAAGQPFDPALLPAVEGDYQRVKNMSNVVNVTPVTTGTDAGVTGNVEDACGENVRAIAVTARNYIGSGDGVEGESANSAANITNSGYIQFATALGVHLEKGIAIDRNTDPLQNNALLVANGIAATNTMALGTVQFSNRNLDAWDLSQQTAYYKLSANDLDNVANEINGDVDVASFRLNLSATNGFAAGSTFRLSNNPSCADTGGAIVSTAWVSGNLTNSNKDAAPSFSVAALAAVFGAGNITDVVAGGPYGAPFGISNYTDRAFICMQVPGGATLIPQSRFSGTGTLFKDHADGGIGSEQANISCPANLAGLGGGIKIDVRNYMDFAPEAAYETYVRMINNSESVTADVTVQYILSNGKYGKWVSLGTLAPREAKFFSSAQIRAAMDATGAVSTNVNADLPANQANVRPGNGNNARLRVSSEAASTLRVQNYLFNKATGLLTEMSSSQGADFVNIEASGRDHIDQDAQTGIKKN